MSKRTTGKGDGWAGLEVGCEVFKKNESVPVFA